MLAQLIYGLCCGWEEVCDHNVLRCDPALQMAVGWVDYLASAPTLSRLKTSSTRAHAAALHGVLLDQFIASNASRRRTGARHQRDSHAATWLAGEEPLPPLLRQLLLSAVVRLLRPGNRDPASVLSALIKLLMRRLRQAWPCMRIVVRGHSGFFGSQALRRFEKRWVHYIVGLAKNAMLLQRVALAELALADMYQQVGTQQRMISEFNYASRSWTGSVA